METHQQHSVIVTPYDDVFSLRHSDVTSGLTRHNASEVSGHVTNDVAENKGSHNPSDENGNAANDVD